MVCHTLPPTIADAFTRQQIINEVQYRDAEFFVDYGYGFGDDGYYRWALRRGFTLTCEGLWFRQVKHMYLCRSIEEGWIIIDYERLRWRRLGWYDSGATFLNEAVERLLEAFYMQESGWETSEDGWRYEVLIPMDSEKARSLLLEALLLEEQ